MITHPDKIIAAAHLHREDLLATAERERRTATLAASPLPWRPLAIRAVALVALILGVRG